ncbi:MAG: class I SAM-dependent methyltransferase, partial [Chloroflexota bacterium]
LGQLLRPRVWHLLGKAFSSGQHALELTCGTGEDAVWLARRGVQVTATDGSAGMVKVAAAKAKRAGVSDLVSVQQASLQQVAQEAITDTFDGVYSNFGGLNTIGDWQPLAQALAKIVKPGGQAILVPMGPWCPWETLWYLGNRQPKTAFRRFRQQAEAKIGPTTIPIWYPSARRLRQDFLPWFRQLQCESLGLWLPPSYLDQFVNEMPEFFDKLNTFEKKTARLTKGWGDHYIMVLERTDITID